MIRDIVFVGAGNLATNVAQALREVGYNIKQVYSRTRESASRLATSVDAEAVADIEQIVDRADLYIVSVKDSALEEVVGKLCNGKRSGLFVHTAGSVPVDVFNTLTPRYGVFYPMQSFSKQRRVDFTEVSFFIEANSKEDTQELLALGKSLGKNVYELSSEARKHLHLAAVFACNFANHCFELSAEVLSKYGIPFDVMLPLIDETARKVHSVSPLKAQTGPAVRYDENVIAMQEKLLSDAPRLLDIYDKMTNSIHYVATNGDNDNK